MTKNENRPGQKETETFSRGTKYAFSATRYLEKHPEQQLFASRCNGCAVTIITDTVGQIEIEAPIKDAGQKTQLVFVRPSSCVPVDTGINEIKMQRNDDRNNLLRFRGMAKTSGEEFKSDYVYTFSAQKYLSYFPEEFEYASYFDGSEVIVSDKEIGFIRHCSVPRYVICAWCDTKHMAVDATEEEINMLMDGQAVNDITWDDVQRQLKEYREKRDAQRYIEISVRFLTGEQKVFKISGISVMDFWMVLRQQNKIASVFVFDCAELSMPLAEKVCITLNGTGIRTIYIDKENTAYFNINIMRAFAGGN